MNKRIQPPFFPANKWFAINSKKLTAIEIRLLIYLGNENVLFDHKDVVINLRIIAEELNVAYVSVRRAMRSLVKKGWIQDYHFSLNKGYTRIESLYQNKSPIGTEMIQSSLIPVPKSDQNKSPIGTEMIQSWSETPSTKGTQKAKTREKKEKKKDIKENDSTNVLNGHNETYDDEIPWS